MDPVTRAVAQQYTDYAYPKPVDDLAAEFAAGGADFSDPSKFGLLMWPEGAPPSPDILVAGCGTQQAAWMAYTNPTSRVVGVDLSEKSLAHQRYLQDKHGLQNLELFQGDLREVGKLGRSFDLVISTGVLHHLPDPGEGLRAIRDVLRPDGAMALMVYGAVGRTGVYMLQDACRRLGLRGDAEGVAMARRMMEATPASHPVRAYMAGVAELEHDEAIVDTFLHPQDRAYTVPQLLSWLEENGVSFQAWINNQSYYPYAAIKPPLLGLIHALPEREQWAAVENIQGTQAGHVFTARLAGRAVPIDFSKPGWLDYRPRLQPNAQIRGAKTLVGLDLSVEMSDPMAALAHGVNGVDTIATILQGRLFAESDKGQVETYAATAFDYLWKIGAVMFEVPRAA